MATNAELYEAVNQAILRLLSGHQESTVNGRRYRLADLDALRRLRNELEVDLAEEDSPGLRVRQVVPRG